MVEFEVWSWWKLEWKLDLKMGGRMMHEPRDRRGRTQQRAGKGKCLVFCKSSGGHLGA